ncbi:MAG: twin-arginine translocation signal domain-containing protein [Ferruginibacter sp.]
MKSNNMDGVSPRRKFLQTIGAGTAALGIATVMAPIQKIHASPVYESDNNDPSPDDWFNQLKGKHRMVFDVTEPHEIFPFAWPKVFSLTNVATGTPEKDVNSVVVLRHNAIPYAFSNDLWAKYNFGEMFKINDPKTQKPSVRNPFWKPSPGDFSVPGLGPVAIGINELQDSGVLFCVCNMAMTVFSAVVADKMKLKADDVKKEWTSNLLPNIPAMPSGVWAVGRAQEHGCGYCFVR